MRQRILHTVLITLALLAVTVLRCQALAGFGTYVNDEQDIVGIAAGFLDFNFNPGWFNYHTLPMYLLSGIYFLMYGVGAVLGVFHSRAEFLSLLFSHEAVFYVPARLLFGFAYVLGAFVLARIVWHAARARAEAVLLFGLLMLLPDGIRAAGEVRVDTFVFLFFALTLHFACFAETRLRNAVLAVVCCAAAVASKIPAVLFVPVLFAKLAWDAKGGAYRWGQVLALGALLPLCVVAFMPYAALDFDAYRPVLEKTAARAGGEVSHLGKTEHAGVAAKVAALVTTAAQGSGWVSVLGAAGVAVYAAWCARALLFPALFVLVFLAGFSTSRTLDAYWLRPAYPVLLFLTVLGALHTGRRLAGQAWLRKALASRAPALDPEHAARGLLGGVLAVLLLVPFGANLPASFAAFGDGGRDSRISAAGWIRHHLPARSFVLLEGHDLHYLPVVPTRDPQLLLANHGYWVDLLDRPLVAAAFSRYQKALLADGPAYRVGVLLTLRRDMDLDRMIFDKGWYIVSTSSFYGRFSQPELRRRNPELATRADRFYGFIRSQELVARFDDGGPVIEIHRFRENWIGNASG